MKKAIASRQRTVETHGRASLYCIKTGRRRTAVRLYNLASSVIFYVAGFYHELNWFYLDFNNPLFPTKIIEGYFLSGFRKNNFSSGLR